MTTPPTAYQLDHNLNSQDCLKAISNIGSTTYRNICTGTEQVVPWGMADWLGATLLTLFVLFILGIFARIMFSHF